MVKVFVRYPLCVTLFGYFSLLYAVATLVVKVTSQGQTS